MLGLSFDKLIILGFVAVMIVGPTRLPGYAAKLAQLVKTVRGMADTAKARMTDELGPDFEDIDWKKLDPRQYDPRRIIRSALLDDEPVLAEEDQPRVTVSRAERKVTPHPSTLGAVSATAGPGSASASPSAGPASASSSDEMFLGSDVRESDVA